MTDLYLALDQGGHASRALLFDARGTLVGQAHAAIRTLRNEAGHVEHDPEELIASLRHAVDQACAALPAGDRIIAAGLATQRSSMACWHRRTSAALSPVISWQDRRNADWLRQLEPHAALIRARTGLVLTPHYGASKMRWCLDHLPAVGAAASAGQLVMGPLASFLLCRLLDERPLAADPANASRTQLWDPATRDWSPELAALFGIGTEVLPTAVTSRHAYGTLPTPAGPVPLTVCTGDQSAVPFAFGALAPTTAYVNVGTGAFVQRAIRDRLPDAPRLLVSVVWSDVTGTDYMLEGTVNGAGSALDWFAQGENADVAALLAVLDTAAAAAPPLAPPLFLNAISGIGSPFWVSNLESRFIGDGTTEAKLAAVLESIVFLLQVNLLELKPHGPGFERILLTGGLSGSAWFCRRLAGLTGLPVLRSEDPEATARGLARLIAGDAGSAWPPPTLTEVRPARNPALTARHLAWRHELDTALSDN